MEDGKIVDLYWERSSMAIAESEKKYGGYCLSISQNILRSYEDARECVNDTWLASWNSIPPHRPDPLSAFFGKIARRISVDRLRRLVAQKRGGGNLEIALDELSECVSGAPTPENEVLSADRVRVINEFLKSLSSLERSVFLRRYWYMDSLDEIALRFGFTESKVRSMLFRIRGKLRRRLEKEELL
ncbi:MAG: RNA polymerase sigma factor [Clostridia bacterium]|nr:RNA polymerase sigma factor [Clostridia bacterium]